MPQIFKAQKPPAADSDSASFKPAAPELEIIAISAGLSQSQARGIALQVLGKSRDEMADALGVSKRTLRLWNADPDYLYALQYARAEVIQTAVDGMRSGIMESLELLRDAVADRTQTMGTRISAAKALMASALKVPHVQQDPGADEEKSKSQQQRETMKKLANSPDAMELLMAARDLIENED